MPTALKDDDGRDPTPVQADVAVLPATLEVP